MPSVRHTPTIVPRDLSEEDLSLYQGALANYTHDVTINDDEQFEAACRLVDAGLGSLRDSNEPSRRRFSAIQLHPLYTEALEHQGTFADVGWYLELFVHPRNGCHNNGLLLARFSGATLGVGRQDRTETTGMNIRVPHASATDFEHDSVQLADFRIGFPTLSHMTNNGWVIYQGIIDAYQAYPLGTGPFDSDEHTGECTNEGCTRHPFGRYTPEKVPSYAALLGERAVLRCRSLVPLTS